MHNTHASCEALPTLDDDATKFAFPFSKSPGLPLILTFKIFNVRNSTGDCDQSYFEFQARFFLKLCSDHRTIDMYLRNSTVFSWEGQFQGRHMSPEYKQCL